MKTEQKPTVSVVIPCWNSEIQLREHLESVVDAAAQVSAEIIVVDDASTDKSVAYLRSLKQKITVVVNDKNLGFSGTVNRGVAISRGDVVILLNTDVEPDRECFVRARSYFGDSHIFAVGFNSGEGWMGGGWNSGLFHHFRVGPYSKLEKTYPSLWASGGQAAFDRRKWLSLGGMDMIYQPFYWEDTDIGYRAWKRGWKVIWAQDCRVAHHHEKSVISANFSQEFVTEIATRNQFLFVWKNIGDAHLLWSHIVRVPLFIKNYPRSFVAALRLLPTVLAHRSHEKKFWKMRDSDILEQWNS